MLKGEKKHMRMDHYICPCHSIFIKLTPNHIKRLLKSHFEASNNN